MKVIKVDIADIENITRKINERRLLFNETICPKGCVDYEMLNEMSLYKEYGLF